MNVHSVGGTELSTSCSVLLWLVNHTWCPLQATVKRNMYVRMCLLWYLSQEWTKLEKPERALCPVGRSSHAACCLNYGEEHPQLLVTGGVDKSGNTLQDAWILDVNSGRWRKVSGDECVTGSTD